jgi:HSP20 family protein
MVVGSSPARGAKFFSKKEKMSMIIVNLKNRPFDNPIAIISEVINNRLTAQSHYWSPPTDVLDTGDRIIIRVEIAGILVSDFSIIYEQNTISISGVRKDSTEEKGAFHQMEINFGDFQTNIDLPAPIDIQSAEATYQDGLLQIALPKSITKHIGISE